jgi:hypothetical protein
LAVSPLTAAAEHNSPRARAAGAVGTVFGGVTPQGFPVVIATNARAREVTTASIALRLNCTSGLSATIPDRYGRMPVSKKGKFHASFGPLTSTRPDGTSFDAAGSIRGAFNKARTKIHGTWSVTEHDHDASGAVTDTCTSGTVRWRARQ